MGGWFSWKSTPTASAPRLLADKLMGELRAMDPQTSTSLTVLLCTIVFMALTGYYYSRKLSRKFAELEATLRTVDERVRAKEAVQAFLLYVLELSRRTDESMNMALYMSEMRRKARSRRPRRPQAVEDRAPELLPTLRVERCEQDGLAVLRIKDGELELESERTEDLDEDNVETEDYEEALIVDTPRPKRRHLAAK